MNRLDVDCRTCNDRGRVPRRSDRPFPGGVTGMKPCPDCNRESPRTEHTEQGGGE